MAVREGSEKVSMDHRAMMDSMIGVRVAEIRVHVQNRKKQSQQDGGKRFKISNACLQTQHDAAIDSAAEIISL